MVSDRTVGKCQICERLCDNPSWITIMSPDTPVYSCKTCKVIWYGGETNPVEIRRHSLHWPVDCYGAYRKSNYDNEPEANLMKTHDANAELSLLRKSFDDMRDAYEKRIAELTS